MTTQEDQEAQQELRKVAQGVQRLLAEHGDSLAMGTSPSVVIYAANADASNPGEELQWHAGIVYRQHVAPKPLDALKALGRTLLSTISHNTVRELVADDGDSGGENA
jgi:hypothetical protein